MAQLKRYLQPYWLFMAATVLIKFLGAVVELQIPDLMEVMLDEKVPAGTKKASICTVDSWYCARWAFCCSM